MKLRLINTVLVVLTITFNAFGQDDFIENGWKAMKLFRTRMTTVEKVLGQPKDSDGRAYNYRTDEFFVQVRYSSALCGEGRFGGGEYEIPLDTVIYYHIIPTKELKLQDLKFRREKYERQVDNENKKLIYYINRELAIMILAGLEDGIEYVGQIYFEPSPKDEEKYKCRRYKSAVEKEQESKPAKKTDCEKPE